MTSVSPPLNRYGLTVLNSGVTPHVDELDDPVVNIVFVHGLWGHPRSTWEAHTPSDSAPTGNGRAPLQGVKKSLNKVQRALDSRKSKSISSNNSSTSTFTSTDSSSSELTNDGPPKDALPKGERPKTSFWPQDMLPLDIPNARILTYGYDADLFSDSRGTGGEIDGFTKHSRSLLVELESETQDDIPIIFCAHDTGGIIVKDALYRSKTNLNQRLKAVYQKTKAVIFFGTPHRASRLTSYSEMYTRVLKLTRLHFGMEKKLVTRLRILLNGELLDAIHADFVKMIYLGNIHVHCFQEGKPISAKIGKVIEDSSAKLDDNPMQIVETIDANHRDMARFSNRFDPGYRKVVRALRRYISYPSPQEDVRRFTLERTSSSYTVDQVVAGTSRLDFQHGIQQDASEYGLYRPLSIENYEIRLLTICSDSNDASTICCTLEYVSLMDSPEYKALSYCWGDPSVTETIKVGNCNKDVTVNLVTALRQLRSQGDSTFWVDAVCINQTDREERALQVRLMNSIFSQATEVIVWVGIEDEQSAAAIDFMESLERTQKSDAAGKTLAEFAEPQSHHPGWTACDVFFARPYWRRVWIIQEIAVASTVQVQCGQRVVSWAAVLEGLSRTKLVHLESFRSSVKMGQLATLLPAMYETRSCLATDSRDKIYALLGLTHDGSEIIRLPNYKQPIELVLIQMTKTLLLRGQYLDHITISRSEHCYHDGLPSWVPDWTNLLETINPWQALHFKFDRIQEMREQKRKEPDRKYFEIHGNALRLTGLVSTTIDKLSKLICEVEVEVNTSLGKSDSNTACYQDTVDEDSFDVRLIADEGHDLEYVHHHLKEWAPDLLIWLKSNQEFFPGGRPLRLYFEPPKTSKLLGAFGDWYSLEKSNLPASPSGSAENALKGQMDLIKKILQFKMRLLVTMDGSLGLAPAQAKVGDSICVIRGCSIPILLRRYRDAWHVVGEVYLNRCLASVLEDSNIQQFSLE